MASVTTRTKGGSVYRTEKRYSHVSRFWFGVSIGIVDFEQVNAGWGLQFNLFLKKF